MGTMGCGEGPPHLRHKGCALSSTDVKGNIIGAETGKRVEGIVFFAERRRLQRSKEA
jgi:hypothetical protein